MRKHGKSRGYDLRSRARTLDAARDFEQDYILVMDESNRRNVEAFALKTGGSLGDKVQLMCDFAADRTYREVPDPYYGGDEGFQLVIDILEDACRGLLERVKQDLRSEGLLT
jgi:protein-tyrosine phosphatase